MNRTDLCVVGASYAGLACAAAAAAAGLEVTVLEAKAAPGLRPHTTGILVQEAIEQLPGLPSTLVRPVRGVRLYSPSLRSFDLHSKGYSFYAADTPGLMRWMTQELLQHSGARLCTGSRFQGAVPRTDGLYLPDQRLHCRYLVGADGARSFVARHFGLDRNQEFLIGMELEFAGHAHLDERYLHVFVDSELAPGYIAWVVPGVGITQVGLACRHPAQLPIERFLEKLRPLCDFGTLDCIGRRGGLIPVGGTLQRFATQRVLLVGDAAGTVSPLTAGGIHKALELGGLAGQAIAEHLLEAGPAPEQVLRATALRYRCKRMLRHMANRGVPNALVETVFGNLTFRRFAQLIFFHHRGLLSRAGWQALFGKDLG
jgi:Dehydrogenases (flavoproteins)